MNPISNLNDTVAALPNYGRLLILLIIAIVLASIPQTSKAGLWFAIVLAIMFVLSLVTGRKFTWDGRTAQPNTVAAAPRPGGAPYTVSGGGV